MILNLFSITCITAAANGTVWINSFWWWITLTNIMQLRRFNHNCSGSDVWMCADSIRNRPLGMLTAQSRRNSQYDSELYGATASSEWIRRQVRYPASSTALEKTSSMLANIDLECREQRCPRDAAGGRCSWADVVRVCWFIDMGTFRPRSRASGRVYCSEQRPQGIVPPAWS